MIQGQSTWVIVKGSGGAGLGDRLRAVCTAIAYARATGRGVSVDWRDGRLGPTGVNQFSKWFSIQGVPYIEPEHLEGLSGVWPLSWEGRLHQSLHEIYVEDGDPPWDRNASIARYSFNPTDDRRDDPVLVSWDFDRLSTMTRLARFNPDGLSEAQFAGYIATSHLKPAEIIERRVEELISRAGNPGCRVGVHVRATHESAAQKGQVPLAHYFRSVDRIIRGKSFRVFLATDNALVERAFRDRYPDLISLSKWFASPGDPLHLNPRCPDAARATEDAIVEMIALAGSDFLVLRGNSSFSIMARLFFQGHPDRLTFVEVRPTFAKRIRGVGRRLRQALGKD